MGGVGEGSYVLPPDHQILRKLEVSKLGSVQGVLQSKFLHRVVIGNSVGDYYRAYVRTNSGSDVTSHAAVPQTARIWYLVFRPIRESNLLSVRDSENSGFAGCPRHAFAFGRFANLVVGRSTKCALA